MPGDSYYVEIGLDETLDDVDDVCETVYYSENYFGEFSVDPFTGRPRIEISNLYVYYLRWLKVFMDVKIRANQKFKD